MDDLVVARISLACFVIRGNTDEPFDRRNNHCKSDGSRAEDYGMLPQPFARSAAWRHRMVRSDEPESRRIHKSCTEVIMEFAPRMLLVLIVLVTSPIMGTRAAAQARQAAGSLTGSAARFTARWVGQDGQDWTGAGPSVGPDGLQDVHIQLSDLPAGVVVKAARVEAPAGAVWESGTNPRLLPNAELIRDAKKPSEGELFFQPDRDLNAQHLRVKVAYQDDKIESVPLVAGPCDPKLRMPESPLPELTEGSLKATWLGQDGAPGGALGDIHVALSGLPATFTMFGAVLTDAVRGTWIERMNKSVSIPDEPSALPLSVKRRADGAAADLFFPPYRDDSRETMTLRLIGADGRALIARFAGGNCDLRLRAPQPAASRILAKPGDDLQALVEKFGTVVLTGGTFRLHRPLLLKRPVNLTTAADVSATLLFDQDKAGPAWTAAIKVLCSNITLDGFAVRFAGPVRWNSEVAWGPAVIGMTDNFDPGYGEARQNFAFTHLDLEIPPIEKKEGWVEALRLMRLIRAQDGVIADNVLRGGPIEFFEGPWRVEDNEFRGTIPGTFSHGVFTGHGTYDLLVRGNRASSPAGSGKTWRFLVLTWQGTGDVVDHNTIEGIGSRDDDTIPWSNEPEIILTEAYHIRYEGKVIALSADGRIVRTGRPQGIAARSGDVISLLNGPAKGQWRRIVQTIDDSTYLVDPPIPAGTMVVSVSQGFQREVFEDNRIDMRGGRRSFGLVLVGNHFGTRVVDNHILGGECAFKLTACPTETPVTWGWTHNPFLGGVIEGNIIEDVPHGGILGLEHDPRYIKSNKGRTYMSVRLDNNIVRWTGPFLGRMGVEGPKAELAGLTLGYPQSTDPGELVVRAQGNRLEAPATGRNKPSLLINGADYNQRLLSNHPLRLPTAGSTVPATRREAGKGTKGRVR
jgi:hypothetical protein